jgi:hypothetical protein
LDRWHQPVGIHIEIDFFFISPKFAAEIYPVEIETQFAATPKHFLHIGRICPAPDFDHDYLPEFWPSDVYRLSLFSSDQELTDSLGKKAVGPSVVCFSYLVEKKGDNFGV